MTEMKFQVLFSSEKNIITALWRPALCGFTCYFVVNVLFVFLFFVVDFIF